jgi:SagB-type dehydrogenase family enzyme
MDSTNRQTDAARLYHEVTKHSYTSVRTDGHVLDWDNKPFPFKIYPHAAALALPRELQLSSMPTLEAMREGAPASAEAPLDLERLTRILFCAGGLTRKHKVGMEYYHFRAAASAGALYPIEIYLASGPEVEGLEAGLYHFSPADLKLRGLRRGDWRAAIARACAMHPAVAQAKAVLILSATFWRSAWKYRARCYRYCYWDAGTILANLLAVANAEGIQADVAMNFADAEIERLVGADGEREGPLCIVALGRGNACRQDTSEVEPLELETVPLSMEEKSYPDLIRMHRASKLLDADEVRSLDARAPIAHEIAQGGGDSPVHTELKGAGLGETILRRGSTRKFAEELITAEELLAILEVSSGHPRCDFPPLSDTYLIANRITGMAPGAYYYSRARRAVDLLKEGDFRGNAGYLCLEQPLGAECSALICYMADFDRLLDTMGNRGYRAAQLEAGLHGGRAYLAAYALERGATGLTFYDDDTVGFFSPHAAGKIPLLMVAIGVPA